VARVSLVITTSTRPTIALSIRLGIGELYRRRLLTAVVLVRRIGVLSKSRWQRGRVGRVLCRRRKADPDIEWMDGRAANRTSTGLNTVAVRAAILRVASSRLDCQSACLGGFRRRRRATGTLVAPRTRPRHVAAIHVSHTVCPAIFSGMHTRNRSNQNAPQDGSHNDASAPAHQHTSALGKVTCRSLLK